MLLIERRANLTAPINYHMISNISTKIIAAKLVKS
jgi:hypothetical protein